MLIYKYIYMYIYRIFICKVHSVITLRNILLEQSNNPKALILAGSPGAGKSSIIEGVKNALVYFAEKYKLELVVSNPTYRENTIAWIIVEKG